VSLIYLKIESLGNLVALTLLSLTDACLSPHASFTTNGLYPYCIESSASIVSYNQRYWGKQILTCCSHAARSRVATQNSTITTPARQQTTQARSKKATRILLQHHYLILPWHYPIGKTSKWIPRIIATEHIGKFLGVPLPSRSRRFIDHGGVDNRYS
jgi:hypothetical protein